MGQNDFILDGMRWSFSSVNTYNTCPQAFRFGYLDALPKVGNAFADWGTYVHSLMEAYFKGKLEFFELSQAYTEGYQDAVVCEFPLNNFCDLAERYYEAGKEYLDRFDGLFEGCEILGVEKRVKIDIGDRPFVGVIDLLVRGKDGIYVIDHKTKSRFKSKKELAQYARQLYLYSLYVKQEYGEWPVKLIFHMVRSGGELVEVPFVEADVMEAKKWFLDTINAIYKDSNFISKPNQIRNDLQRCKEKFDNREIKFTEYIKEKMKLETALKNSSWFCRELCSSREMCPEKDKASKEG